MTSAARPAARLPGSCSQTGPPSRSAASRHRAPSRAAAPTGLAMAGPAALRDRDRLRGRHAGELTPGWLPSRRTAPHRRPGAAAALREAAELTRKRAVFHGCLSYAAELGLLEANPWTTSHGGPRDHLARQARGQRPPPPKCRPSWARSPRGCRCGWPPVPRPPRSLPAAGTASASCSPSMHTAYPAATRSPASTSRKPSTPATAPRWPIRTDADPGNPVRHASVPQLGPGPPPRSD
jgi:hypothetical protein